MGIYLSLNFLYFLNPIPKTLSETIRINNCCGIKLCLLHIYSFFPIKVLVLQKTFVLYQNNTYKLHNSHKNF